MYKSVFVNDIHNQLMTSVNPEISCTLRWHIFTGRFVCVFTVLYILRYNILRNVYLDTLNKRAANYLRVLIFAILLSFAEIAEINTRENMSPKVFRWGLFGLARFYCIAIVRMMQSSMSFLHQSFLTTILTMVDHLPTPRVSLWFWILPACACSKIN